MAKATEVEIRNLVNEIFAQMKSMKMESSQLDDGLTINKSEKREQFWGNITPQTKFVTAFGAELSEKPEHMTHLKGNLLVFKDHPRIAFRGKVDSLEAEIMDGQCLADKMCKKQLTNDLQEVLEFVRNLIHCEVLEEAVGEFQLQGLDAKLLREMSHYPNQYFGRNHFLPDYRMGAILVCLNKLRTKTRETELAAYSAFKDASGMVSKNDIIKALNRLSSLFWIMMFKEITGKYHE